MVSNIDPRRVVESISKWIDTQIKRGDKHIPIEQARHWGSALKIAAPLIEDQKSPEFLTKKISFLGIKTALCGLRLHAVLNKEPTEIFDAALDVLENLNPEPNPQKPIIE